MPTPSITVYSSPTCQPCRLTKRKFTDAGIRFWEVDLADPANESRLAALKAETGESILTMPVVALDGRVAWMGMHPDKINALIQEARS